MPTVRLARRYAGGCGILAAGAAGLSGGTEPPQSDGAGIGAFGPAGRPEVSKQPIAAWQDTDFARAARHLRGTTFVAHVRYASTGAHTMANTHPFLQDGRLFAHNGVVQGLPDLDRRLAELGTADLVHGETDSERVFALITGETRRHGGDLHRGIVEAIGWIAVELPVFALNLVLTTATDLWALRYPDTHELTCSTARRAAAAAAVPWRHTARISARSTRLAAQPSVIIASEKIDDDPAWRLLDPGELLHIGPSLGLSSSAPFPPEPRHPVRESDLNPAAAASQHPS